MSVNRRNPGQEPAASLIPGAYERNTLTYCQLGSMGTMPASAIPAGLRSMDAATIADRAREGGGAPNQRRRKAYTEARTTPLRDAVPKASWLSRGYLWFQRLRLAHR
jgi:hypothetical protein